MMMSPSASGKLTARKGINEVKDALSSTLVYDTVPGRTFNMDSIYSRISHPWWRESRFSYCVRRLFGTLVVEGPRDLLPLSPST